MFKSEFYKHTSIQFSIMILKQNMMQTLKV